MNATSAVSAGASWDIGTFAPLKPISADSHITEPPGCYSDRIDPKYRDVAPYIVHDENRGDVYVINGFPDIVPMNLIAAAGEDPQTKGLHTKTFADLHRGGWNPKDRMADQDRDGVAAEIVYPTVGMLLCNHPDYDYKHACFEAYNRWLAEFVSGAPTRIFGIGQTAARTPSDLIADLHKIKEAGFVGVMMPGIPAVEDYDSEIYDPVWRTAIELGLPLSFHVLTSSNDNPAAVMRNAPRGPRINIFHHVIRACQDIVGMFIYTGVFDRHPDLKLVTVEADAGWAPHFMHRMDLAYTSHRVHLGSKALAKLPSEYFLQNIYMTFQDDVMAFRLSEHMNEKRLLWANDFPHSDSTWPHSQELLAEQTVGKSLDTLKAVLHDNAAELYRITV